MLTWVAGVDRRSPRRVLLLVVILAAAAGVFGAPVASRLSGGGLTDTSAPSSRADALLWARFRLETPNFVLLAKCPGGANSPTARLDGVVLTARLDRQPDVVDVASYWVAPPADQPELESTDGRYALVTATVQGNDNMAPKRAAALARMFSGDDNGLQVLAGGQAVVASQVNHQVSHDLGVAEAIAVPLTLIALVLVFGSAVAALLPLCMGAISVLGALAVLRGLTYVTPVSVYGLNMTTAMGLGLGIDYSLFILSRYREQLRAGDDVHSAVSTAVLTAGRTVLFSSLTVGLSMVALLLFPFYLLRSFAYAGLATVVIAALGATIVLPALLSVLGTRTERLDVRPLLRRLVGWRGPPQPGRFWRHWAQAVMRRPLLSGAGVVILLVVLGAPFLSARFGFPDDRVLPAADSSHQVGDVLRSDFKEQLADSLLVLVPDTHQAPASALATYAARLSLVPGVREVGSPEGTFVSGRQASAQGTPVKDGAAYFSVGNNLEPYSVAGSDLVSAVRAVPAPAPALVTGLAARSVDALAAIGAALPWAIGLIACTTFAVLFMFSGGVLVPLKALVMNTLSLSATFGAMVWVFQEGHIGWALGPVNATGYLEAVMPVLMFCIAFGLSMDYEVFLVSRIKEAWEASDRSAAANRAAVAEGLGRTGGIVTAAAALLSIVFFCFASSQVNFIKMFGTGLALAVLVDATLVRGVLVPAFMRLAGRANWWSPSWLSWAQLPEQGPGMAPGRLESDLQPGAVGPDN